MELPSVSKIVFLTLLVLAAGLILGLPLKVANTTGAGGVELLDEKWQISSPGEAAEKYQVVNQEVLKEKSTLELVYDLKGTCLLDGDASAVIFDQDGWKYIELSKYGENCKDGEQRVSIVLSDFKDIITGEVLDTNKDLTGLFHIRFWLDKPYEVEIASAVVTGNSNENAVTYPQDEEISIEDKTEKDKLQTEFVDKEEIPVITKDEGNEKVDSNGWQIRSVDAMKDTKDAICNPRPRSWIERFTDMAVEVGANYVAISTPYDNPKCGDSVEYTKLWIDVIRSKGLKVWHRQMPLAFENIYDAGKNNSGRDLNIVVNYIKANSENYKEGDIITPIPEPQNGGITGITHCAYGYCQFKSAKEFNVWLREAMYKTDKALADIGMKGKVKAGYFGFDGFVAWGANNPDWNGILEDETVRVMGNITIDHYPEAIGSTMEQGLNELEARYPGVDIIIGEWGTINGGNVKQQVKDTMHAAKRPSVKGFNYWQFGPSGAGEQLINNNFSKRPHFEDVESFYKN